MLPIVPNPTVIIGLIFGSVVLKLLAAMNAEKQVAGKAASASSHIRMAAGFAPMILGSMSVEQKFVGRGDAQTESARDDEHPQSAGDDRRQGNSHQSAEMNVFRIAVVHAEIDAGGAGGGEKSDDIGRRSCKTPSAADKCRFGDCFSKPA